MKSNSLKESYTLYKRANIDYFHLFAMSAVFLRTAFDS